MKCPNCAFEPLGTGLTNCPNCSHRLPEDPSQPTPGFAPAFLAWGLVSLPGTAYLSVRLVVEMTFWTYERGEQMVGFSLIHTSPAVLFLFLSAASSALFVLFSLGFLFGTPSYRGPVFRWHLSFFAVSALLVAALLVPYSMWQRVMLLVAGPGPQGPSLMLSAALHADQELVASFLDNGVNINSRNYMDETAAMQAAKTGNTRMLDFLISRGADLHATTVTGENILTLAGEWHNFKFAREMYRRGVRPVCLPDTFAEDYISTDERIQRLLSLEDSLNDADPHFSAMRDTLIARSIRKH